MSGSVHSGQSICDIKDARLKRYTARFDQKLVKKLSYKVPGLRPTMIDHQVMRLPMNEDKKTKKLMTLKPDKYMTWTGDSGGDFCRPYQAAVTNGPTNFDIHLENIESINGIENHFSNYFNSGEKCQFPDWTRSHWTMNCSGDLLSKKDRRHAATREINASTVQAGPYWSGYGNEQNRPKTGVVLSSKIIERSSIYYDDKNDDPGGMFNTARETNRNQIQTKRMNSPQVNEVGDEVDEAAIMKPVSGRRASTSSRRSRRFEDSGNKLLSSSPIHSSRVVSSRRVGPEEANLWGNTVNGSGR